MPSRSTISLSKSTLALIEEVILQQLLQVERSDYVLKFPPLRDYVMEAPGLHFHFNPEFVIGLNGESLYQFIGAEIEVGSREMAVIPAGIPHCEKPQLKKTGTFQNILVSVYNQTVCLQWQNQPRVWDKLRVEQCYLDSPKFSLLASYLNEMAEFHQSKSATPSLGVKGLLLAYLETLLGIIRHSRAQPTAEKLKISQVKKLVHEHLSNSELSVGLLAGLLHCSADYLSHLYHSETQEYLARYINRERVEAAMKMLQATTLTIAEIAFGVGFENPAYFSQVFKQITFKTPQDYRRSVERSFVELEGRPRTIYALE